MEDEHTVGADAALGCARANERIAAFAAGEEDPAEERALHAHLGECASCRDTYESALLIASKIGRGARRGSAARASRELPLPKRRPVLFPQALFSRAPFPGAPGAPRAREGRRRRWGVLLTLATALVLLAWVLSGAEQATARFALLAGEAKLGATSVLAGAPAEALRGQWCATGPDSRARLEVGPTVLELGPRTRLLLEDPRACRVRLESGWLEFVGPCTVTSLSGVVSTDAGRGTLRILPAGLEVTCRLGSVRASNSFGVRALGPDETFVLATDGASVAP